MPKIPRPVSESGYYHLILRGNGKQIVFEEKSDYAHFLHLLKKNGQECKVAINAFCLMENHVHLLVCDREGNLSAFMKNLAGNYAIWFNKKYSRIGHLFQGRYRSKVIESEDTLCTVFRYILNNPRDAGICPAAKYPWSSYNRYGNPNSFVDTKILMEMLGSYKEYEDYINAKYEDQDLLIREHDDEWAKLVMKKTLNIQDGSVIRTYDWVSRNQAIRMLREKGLSIRQIERLTGISKSVIQRA